MTSFLINQKKHRKDFLMSNSFLILNRSLITDKRYRNKIDNDGLITYMLLSDRMKVSMKNGWVDSRNQQTFIYYPVNSLTKDVRVGRTKMSKILKVFKSLGLISTLRNPNGRCNRIFMPKFTLQTSRSSKFERVSSNNKSNNNKISNSKSDNRLKGVRNRWDQTNIPKIDDKLDHQNAVKAIKYRRIPKPVIRVMRRDFSGKTLNTCIHVLLQAKESVLKDLKHANKYTEWSLAALNFDLNSYFTYNHAKNFAKYIDHGLRKAWHDSKPGKAWHYFMAVCKHYYNYAIRWFNQNRPVNVNIRSQNGPEIPIFKL